jgi:hypothetical protein
VELINKEVKNMKKILSILFSLMIIFISSFVYSQDSCLVSTTQTADAKIVSGAGIFYGIVVNTDGASAVTITVYDNTAASGSTMIDSWVVTTSATTRAQAQGSLPGVAFSNGIYVDITSAGSVSYKVFYDRN